MSLPQARIAKELTSAADGYHLRLSSPVLARSVSITFGAASTELSDNYFDLLPGETVDVTVKSRETLESLRSNLQVVSLVDAFKKENTDHLAAVWQSRYRDVAALQIGWQAAALWEPFACRGTHFAHGNSLYAAN